MRILFLSLFISTFSFAQQRPNIIYIMSDDHDADAISAYNKKLIRTPNIDRIAREGMFFSRAFCSELHLRPCKGNTDNRSALSQERNEE